jgi:hypothetical protein
MEVIALRERICGAVIAALLLCVIPAATALGQGTISIDPATQDVNLDVSAVCSVDVLIDDGVVGLTGYDVEILYDGTLLDVTDVVEGALPPTGGTTFFFWTEEGPPQKIIIHGAILGTSVDGPGVLATIEFIGLTDGTSPVTFSFVELRDILNDPIPVTAIDGEIVLYYEASPVEDGSWSAIKALYR